MDHGLKRLAACHLFSPRERRVVGASLLEFLVSGLRYLFPSQLGLLGEGMPTSVGATVLKEKVRLGEEDTLLVLTGYRCYVTKFEPRARRWRQPCAPSLSLSDPKRRSSTPFLVILDQLGRAGTPSALITSCPLVVFRDSLPAPRETSHDDEHEAQRNHRAGDWPARERARCGVGRIAAGRR